MVFNSTMSPITKFLLRAFYFWRSCNDCRYSFFQRNQSSLAMCGNRLQRLLQNISGLRNFSSSGMTNFDCIVKMLAGDNGWKLPGSFIVFTVKCWGFRIPSTSDISVRRDSSPRLFPCVFNIDAKIAHAERVCLSQTPRMWHTNGGFLCHFVQSPLIPSMEIGSCCHPSQNMPSSVLFLHQ